MNKIIANTGLALCFVLATALLGCGKTTEQEGKKDGMKNAATEMKKGTNDVADKVKETAGQMQDSAVEMKDDAGQYFDDATITAMVKEQLVREPSTSAYQISVETLNGTVQLSGFVQSSAERNKAEEIAKAVPGVKSVKNDLVLKSKTEGSNNNGKIKTA